MNIKDIIRESIEVKNHILQQDELLLNIQLAAISCIKCFQSGGKVLLCGNGGSAADAQHIAAELSGRFYYDRPPLYAEALHVNSSYMTAVSNDYGYDKVYSRMVRAMGRKNDILIGLSTSGNSQNVINAMNNAQKLGMITIGLTGADGGKLKDVSEILICVPSINTARIQESHIMIGHILCELIESELFPRSS
ncbi:MAG: D-sedoheptulose 7-phosphate isomerase [Bacteroidales bacterium]|nr:D-sedoheptulose 7-phosphate isomerase [Bacteroidales bacterium]